MTVLRWIIRVVVGLALLIVVAFFGARFLDGPLGPIPGGALVSGERVSEPVADWSFAKDVPEIALQLASQSQSRTTWILVSDGKAYIPASTEYPPGKTWHRLALEDGRATLRIDGKLYPVTLAKVEDPLSVATVRDVASRKYPSRPPGDAWLFQVTSRSGGAG
ncbi:MAG: hypothetical protein NTZ61_20530 [Proteobacteria bacterium]|nr:hypothetical protein [Pseudomonadota bacterium]